MGSITEGSSSPDSLDAPGDDEDPSSLVRRPDVRSRYREGGIVSQQVQVSPHEGQETPLTGRDVLDDDRFGRTYLDDPELLAPGTRLLARRGRPRPALLRSVQEAPLTTTRPPAPSFQ